MEVFDHATEACLQLPVPMLDRTRAAAVEVALVTTTGWADRTDSEFPPS
jgi:hypothetical protein